MRPGTRVMCLDHPLWQGGKLQGYEGTFKGYREDGLLIVRFPFLVRDTYLPGSCVCPVYNDCEVCGYGAWTNRERKDGWHHFCAWHIPC